MRKGRWYRGNTHMHSTVSDGDLSPDGVVKWYHDRNYNFVVLTDYNKFVDPGTVTLPDKARQDFILIPGEEITDNRMIHTTAMNIKRQVSWICDEDEHPSTEEMWDELLTSGKKIFAVAADDAHGYHAVSPKTADPGRGWVMVWAEKLDADTITNAMLNGDFYCSTGVFLKTCEKTSGEYTVEVDVDKTKQEIASLPSIAPHCVENGVEGFRIEFIGTNGTILETVDGEKGCFKRDQTIPYVRAKVTFGRKQPDASGYEQYYAWGQPVW